MANIHRLKTCAPFFEDVKWERKTFEVRKNDRDYRKGDYLVLDEWLWSTANGHHFSREDPLVRIVTYVLHGGQYGIAEGHAILGIDKLGEDAAARTILDVAPPREDRRPSSAQGDEQKERGT